MKQKELSGVLLDERTDLSLNDLCRACSSSAEWIIELVEEGVLEPIDVKQDRWRFSGTCLHRARTARRLQCDLEINLPGVALALQLLDEIETLKTQIYRIDSKDIN